MKVYAVIYHDCDGTDLICICSTYEKANALVDMCEDKESYFIEEYGIDEVPKDKFHHVKKTKKPN
jgi:hypothetical protein